MLCSFYSVEKIAKDRGYSMAQIALAWVMSNPHVSAPIVGVRLRFYFRRS
jgi:aryl-alcohol dehydrogenase-like predicted oxidoreductase